jgi:hypothetical protein
VLPASSPYIFTGMRVSLAVALIVMVISEMVAASSGIGYFILSAQRGFKIREMFAGVLTLAALGYVLNRLFLLSRNRVLAWHYGYTQQRSIDTRHGPHRRSHASRARRHGRHSEDSVLRAIPGEGSGGHGRERGPARDARARRRRLLADAPAIGTWNTVFTLNTHIGTHIDAPRHFYADGGAVDELALDRHGDARRGGARREHKPAGRRHRAATWSAPASSGAGQIAVIKTLWTDRAWGKPNSGTTRSISSRAWASGSAPGRAAVAMDCFRKSRSGA